jgi:oxygen-dependent protoporphyrinogen oxidase
MSRVGIIGGGISGLATAYYLSREGIPCTLFEAEPRLGGVIQTESVDGCVVEAGPDSFISQKPWALELIRELGLEGEVIGSNDHLRKTYILRRGRLTPMPDGLYLMVPTAVWPLATTSLLSAPAKCRMALELLRSPSSTPPQDRSVAEFIRDHYGEEAVDYLAEPLLAGIYGGDAADLSVASVLPRFVEIEQRYGSLTRGVLAARRNGPAANPTPLFLTLKRGMRQLVETLEEKLARHTTVVHAAVTEIAPASEGFHASWAGGSIEVEHLVLATPAHTAAALLRRLDPDLAGLLSQIRYHSSVTIALVYDRAPFRYPLDGFGFLIPRVERRLLTACTWVGTKFPHRVPDNRILLRAFIGAGTDEELLGRADQSFVTAIQEELRRLMGVTVAPLHWRVQRWRRAMAQYTVGHRARLDKIQERVTHLPGLQLAGNAYLGIGIPDCIHTAQVAANRIAGALRGSLERAEARFS